MRIALDTEINAYRGLLEGEESRLGITTPGRTKRKRDGEVCVGCLFTTDTHAHALFSSTIDTHRRHHAHVQHPMTDKKARARYASEITATSLQTETLTGLPLAACAPALCRVRASLPVQLACCMAGQWGWAVGLGSAAGMLYGWAVQLACCMAGQWGWARCGAGDAVWLGTLWGWAVGLGTLYGWAVGLGMLCARRSCSAHCNARVCRWGGAY